MRKTSVISLRDVFPWAVAIRSIKTNNIPGKRVESLGDLVTPRHSHLRIYAKIAEKNLIKGSSFAEELLPRVDLVPADGYDKEGTKKMYENIFRGSHVWIGYERTINIDYNTLLDDEFQCRYPQTDLGVARYPLQTLRVGWLYRKGFALQEKFNIVGLKLYCTYILTVCVFYSTVPSFLGDAKIFSARHFERASL